MNDNLLTLTEAAALLNIKEGGLRGLIFKKQIPYIKIGRLVRFKRETLIAWLETHTKSEEK